MAKNNVADLDTTAANNTDFAGTDSTGTTGLVKNGDNILRTIGAMLKKWWNDLGGTATVGGTANAITLTSASTYQSLVSGIRILFKPSADNSGATTLNLDSLGAKAIRKISGGTDIALTAKDLLSGKRAEVVYDSTANAAAGAWILLDVQGDQLNFPAGAVIDWNSGTGTLSYSGSALVSNSTFVVTNSAPFVMLRGTAAGQNAIVAFQTGVSDRWYVYKDSTVESGSNAGSNFHINAYDDTGTVIDQPVSITRAANGSITIRRPFGYGTGVGGAVTQITSKATGVTLSKATGQITMNNAALAAATTVSFTLTNTLIAATDILVLNHVSGGTAGSYLLNAQCAAGSASINVRNVTAGSLSEAIVIGFVLIKGAAS